MIPTIAASTGAPFFPSASPAARPSRTMRTFSSTPAPTPSTANSVAPLGESSRLSGCTSSSFAPSNFPCFWVDTTVPTTRAICMNLARNSKDAELLSNVPVIDDSNDARVDGRFDGIKRKACFFASHEKDVLAHSGANAVHSNQRLPRRLALRCQRLDEKKLEPAQIFIFSRDDDGADDLCNLHGQSLTVTVSITPTMAASTGQSFSPDAIRAELPLTMSTVSPTPASTVSTATRWLPSALPFGSMGRTSRSLLATSRGSLRVATTVPTIFARSTRLQAFAVEALPIGSASSRLACGQGMTCTDTSSPARRAAAAPASVAALTAATSPRTIAVT